MGAWQMLCPYRDALGTPGTGVHGARVFGLAAFDVAGTVLLALFAGRGSPYASARAFADVRRDRVAPAATK